MKRASAVGLCVVSMTWSGIVFAAPTKAQCIGANEDGQDSRRTGKLHAAIDRFSACVVASCPEPVRRDCETRREESRRAVPSLIFRPHSADGTLIRGVRVAIDGGSPVLLDGTELELDPGVHTFEFDVAGYNRVAKELALAEGTKRREEPILFLPIASAAAETGPHPSPPLETLARAGKTFRIAGIALGGAAALALGTGVFFALRGESNYDDALTNHCNTRFACDPSGVAQWKTAETDNAISAGSFVTAGALLAAATVFYFVVAPRVDDTSARTAVAKAVR